MERSQVMQIAETARLQLMATTAPNVLCSWGIEKFIGTTYNGMAALAFKVNGRLHQGMVVVAYNEADYYEVHLLDATGVKCIARECYWDCLGSVIDEHIERGPTSPSITTSVRRNARNFSEASCHKTRNAGNR